MKSRKQYKLVSKRAFARQLFELMQEYAWLLNGRALEVRPGWIRLLTQVLRQFESVLTKEDINENRLEYLYSATGYRLQVFVDISKLSEARTKVIEFLLEELKQATETSCPKCGIRYTRENHPYTGDGCMEHCDFDGDFLEDYRRFKRKEKLKVVTQEEDRDSEASDDELTALEPDQQCESEQENQLRVYRLEDVKKVLKTLKSRSAELDQRNRIKSVCEDLLQRGEFRPYCELPENDNFNDLIARYPNFSESVGMIRNAVALAKVGNGVLELPPLLLVGPPGIGKTMVANEIAKLLKTDFLEIRMETEQSGAGIAGSSEFWSNTQTGLIFKVVAKGKTANPVVVLDELDKVSGDGRFDPLGGLYSLLEKETARRFEDQSIRGLPIDASGIIWLITANDERLIPAPILSRVMMQHIRPPTWEESIGIAHSIYAGIRKQRAWGDRFESELDNQVAERLAAMEPRKMKLWLLNAFGKAAVAGRRAIKPDDLPPKVTSVSFGFVSDAQG